MFKEGQYLPGPGELGASERRVTLLLLTIILTHMVLTLPARVCRNKILIYSPQELVSTIMIHVKIARTFAIVRFIDIVSGGILLWPQSVGFRSNADIVKSHSVLNYKFSRGSSITLSLKKLSENWGCPIPSKTTLQILSEKEKCM